MKHPINMKPTGGPWNFFTLPKGEPKPIKWVSKTAFIGNERVTINFETGTVDIQPIK